MRDKFVGSHFITQLDTQKRNEFSYLSGFVKRDYFQKGKNLSLHAKCSSGHDMVIKRDSRLNFGLLPIIIFTFLTFLTVKGKRKMLNKVEYSQDHEFDFYLHHRDRFIKSGKRVIFPFHSPTLTLSELIKI
jgi:hypothetical protein